MAGLPTAFQPTAFQNNAFQTGSSSTASTTIFGPRVDTTLTIGVVPAKTFTKKHYSDLLNEIRYEGEIARSLLEGLSERDKADLDYENAQAQFAELEGAFNRSVTAVNWDKTAEAKEKLEKARKNRDHHYYMEIVNKAWAEFNKGQKK